MVLGDRLDQARWRFGTIPFYVFDNAPGYQHPVQVNTIDEDLNFAIAISGGGTRSAVFAAGVMEQVAALKDPRRPARSALDSCDVVSGVSGGSMAAVYYGLRKPATFSDSAQTAEFFQRFKSEMTVDFVMRSFQHYVSHPWEAAAKYYTRYRFAQTLAATLDQYLFGGATFGTLHERELSGASPVIIVNASSLDTGQKFLFTNQNVSENFVTDRTRLNAAIDGAIPAADQSNLKAMAAAASSPVCQPFGFDMINSDITSFRVASAITASSSYPVLPGPSALINYTNDTYVHLADGGVSDNYGVDAVVQLYLGRLQRDAKPRKLVVLSIDASAAPKARKLGDPNGYVGGIAYAERAAAFGSGRGEAFASALYQATDSVKVIRVSVSDSPQAAQLEGPSATLCISEKDFITLLACAQDAVAAHRDELLSALSGR
jgi:predicted acylesterase/phospholipase RssA